MPKEESISLNECLAVKAPSLPSFPFFFLPPPHHLLFFRNKHSATESQRILLENMTFGFVMFLLHLPCVF